LNTKGELDWTVDHRSTNLNFAAGPMPKAEVSAVSDIEAGALSTIRTVEVNIQRSFSSGSGTDVEADIEMKNSLSKVRVM
jgi:hypothetical protein